MQEAPEPTSDVDLFRWISWAQMKAAEEWIKARDLSQLQAFTLGFLVKNPGAIQRELAEVARTTPANMSMMLQVLEQRGYIERRADATSDRIKRVYATDAGGAIIAGFDATMAASNDAILAPLDDSERAQLHRLLTRITAALPRPSR